MASSELLAIIFYFVILVGIGVFSYKKHLSASDFIIGSRSMNFWLTALAAHASDMSSWLFMGYPAVIFSTGLYHGWTAIGLIVFMYLNWQLVAPKIRIATEQFNSLTFSSFFESRLADTSGVIRVFTAVICFFFYTIYISAGLVGLGILLNTLFGIDYFTGIWVGILFVVPYVFMGGYLTLAWIDLFQGFFLLGVILFVPFHILAKVGGWGEVKAALEWKHLSFSLLPNLKPQTILQAALWFGALGLGYFGQPHIVTKFMGISKVTDIVKSKFVGMSWMTLSLAAATFVGLVGIAFFPMGIEDPQRVFIDMVRASYSPFFIGFILCAVVAATINAMGSQVLVLSSTLTEDFYKRLIHRNASSKELLLVSRLGIIFVALIAFAIAHAKIATIFKLVEYAWSGLGASFGPLLLLCLYSKRVTKYGAWAGILSGGITSAIWLYIDEYFDIKIPSLIPSFAISFVLILFISELTYHKKQKKLKQ